MDTIKDLKHAEEILTESIQIDDVKHFIENELASWDFEVLDDCLNVSKVNELFCELNNEVFENDQNDLKTEALHWVVFDKIHVICWSCISEQFSKEDLLFFEKCRILSGINVSAEHFGADENYTIPLSAAIVELSVLDNYKTPSEKMNCLCSTYDLVFAEIKTAMVAVISQNSERENEIPIIDNRDVIPVLMVVIIKSKLVHVFSNLYYIKSFYYKMESKRIVSDIFKSFEEAVDALMEVDLTNLPPVSNRIIKSIDVAEYMRITSCNEDKSTNKSLVDEANRRVLHLISKSTDDDQ